MIKDNMGLQLVFFFLPIYTFIFVVCIIIVQASVTAYIIYFASRIAIDIDNDGPESMERMCIEWNKKYQVLAYEHRGTGFLLFSGPKEETRFVLTERTKTRAR